jgi:orotidine-5'-phosphate decarboxylase
MAGAFADRLIEAVRRAGSPLCVGIDPFPDQIPALFGDAHGDARALLRFGVAMIDCAVAHAGVIKPQLGLFEAYGEEGYAVARILVNEARAKGLIVILDAKRGDIGSTAEGYARATLGPAPGFDADCVTVNPYLGLDSLEPFVAVAEQSDKGVAVLVRTSNPGAHDLQDLDAGGAPVWARVAEMIEPLCPRLKGATGWSGLMAVAGATAPEQARTLRERLPASLFLVPGYGAQGARAGAALAGFRQGPQGLEGGVVNSSRALSYPPAAQAAKSLAEWREAIGEAMALARAELAAAALLG